MRCVALIEKNWAIFAKHAITIGRFLAAILVAWLFAWRWTGIRSAFDVNSAFVAIRTIIIRMLFITITAIDANAIFGARTIYSKGRRTRQISHLLSGPIAQPNQFDQRRCNENALFGMLFRVQTAQQRIHMQCWM